MLIHILCLRTLEWKIWIQIQIEKHHEMHSLLESVTLKHGFPLFLLLYSNVLLWALWIKASAKWMHVNAVAVFVCFSQGDA